MLDILILVIITKKNHMFTSFLSLVFTFHYFFHFLVSPEHFQSKPHLNNSSVDLEFI